MPLAKRWVPLFGCWCWSWVPMASHKNVKLCQCSIALLLCLLMCVCKIQGHPDSRSVSLCVRTHVCGCLCVCAPFPLKPAFACESKEKQVPSCCWNYRMMIVLRCFLPRWTAFRIKVSFYYLSGQWGCLNVYLWLTEGFSFPYWINISAALHINSFCIINAFTFWIE